MKKIRANITYWKKELRKNICTNFGRRTRVNGENSGRTKLLYIFITKGNVLQTKEPLKPYLYEWKKTSGVEILKDIEFIKPLVFEKT